MEDILPLGEGREAGTEDEVTTSGLLVIGLEYGIEPIPDMGGYPPPWGYISWF